MLNYKILSNQPGAKWVVMIHGAGGHMEVWFKQVAEYSRHFNLLLVDLACHGESNHKEVFTPDFDFDVAQIIRTGYKFSGQGGRGPCRH